MMETSFAVIEPKGRTGSIIVRTVTSLTLDEGKAMIRKIDPYAPVFAIGHEDSRLRRYLSVNVGLLSPENAQHATNWRVLSIILNQPGALKEILGDYISTVSKAAALLPWQRLFKCLHFPTEEWSFLDVQIKKCFEESRQIVADMSNQIFQKAVSSLTESKTYKPKEVHLSAVELIGDAYSGVVNNLGDEYRLFSMIKSADRQTAIGRLVLHEKLLEVLQKYGFPKFGLTGQAELTTKDKTKASRNTILKHLTTLGVSSPSSALLKKQLIELTEAASSVTEGNDIVSQIAEGTSKSLQSAAASISTAILPTAEYLRLLKDREILEKEASKNTIKLDNWQRIMIDHIRDRRSVLVRGPTSGGKTFASMAAIDALINTDGNIVLLYCAPTDHLCLQTWASISKTFPRQKVAIVCGIFSYLPPGATIYIGTPIETLTYIRANHDLSSLQGRKPVNFDIGIFDEVHTLSTTFADSSSSRIRSEAMGILLSFIKKQVVAISATIHDEDLPLLSGFIQAQTGITSIETILYGERPIPTTRFIWNGHDLTSSNPKVSVPLVAIQPVTTFKLIRLLRESDRLPALFFESDEKSCFDGYLKLVEWISSIEETEFQLWLRLREESVSLGKAYNEAIDDFLPEWNASQGSDKQRKALLPRARLYSKQREQLQIRLDELIKSVITEAKALETPYKCIVTEEERQMFLRMGITLRECPAVLYDIAKEVNHAYKPSHRDIDFDLEHLPALCQDAPPYLRIGPVVTEAATLRQIHRPSKTKQERKQRLQMLLLCKAERIREREVEPLFRIIARGLDYGIGIILPTMPFVVQYEMLKLLNRRILKLVFASQSMSMGINYPIRTVIVRSEDAYDCNVCEYLQMEGRAGRRGLDTHGYTVAWNIVNAPQASLKTLPRMEFPAVTKGRGSFIPNHVRVAIDIECRRVNLTDTAGIEAVIGKLTVEIDKAIESGKVQAFDLLDKDEHDEDEEISRKTVKEKNGITSSVSDQDLATSIVGCIAPVMQSMGIPPLDVLEVTYRIQMITLGRISHDVSSDPYRWALVISNIKRALQEIYTRILFLPNPGLCTYISLIYELLHRIQYRQMRLG